MQGGRINTFDNYDSSLPADVESSNPFDQRESETLLHNPTPTNQSAAAAASPQDQDPIFFIGSYDSGSQRSDLEPIIIGPPQDNFNDDGDNDEYAEPDQSRNSLLSSISSGHLKEAENHIPYDDDYSDTKCSASTPKTQKNISQKKNEKKKLSDEERQKRLDAHEENKKKYQVGKLEICFMTSIAIGIIAAVVVIVVMHDQIWPPPVETPRPTQQPTPEPSLAPTTAQPSYQPSLSMVPSYEGYRDTEILNNLRRITPSLPDVGADLDNSTPQSKAAKFIIYDDPLHVKPYEKDEIMHRYALVTLYYATNGKEWNNSSLWLSKESICMWHGISCSNSLNDNTDGDDIRYVTKTILKENNMIGEIPWEMKALSNLTDISFEKNSLNGDTIFSIVVSMDKLKSLDLRNNQFMGEIDSNIAFMSNLQLLYLEGNQFYGSIPVDLGKSQTLVAITMHRNNFTGYMPDEICYSDIINDYTADCYDDFPINCTCCSDPFNQCY